MSYLVSSSHDNYEVRVLGLRKGSSSTLHCYVAGAPNSTNLTHGFRLYGVKLVSNARRIHCVQCLVHFVNVFSLQP